MSCTRFIRRYSLCVVGVHKAPPRRKPHGAIVADCVCCGETHCFYGSSARSNRHSSLDASNMMMIEPVKVKLLGPAKTDAVLLPK